MNERQPSFIHPSSLRPHPFLKLALQDLAGRPLRQRLDDADCLRALVVGQVLAAVRDENNAVIVRAKAVGEMIFVGKGAGSLPTAAAVLSDVIEIAI